MGPGIWGEEWSYTGAEWSPPLEERRQSVHTDAQHGGNVVVLFTCFHFLGEIRSILIRSQDGRESTGGLRKR